MVRENENKAIAVIGAIYSDICFEINSTTESRNTVWQQSLFLPHIVMIFASKRLIK
jgi:hypothetical protein